MSARLRLGTALVAKHKATRPPADIQATLDDLRDRVRNIAVFCSNRPSMEFFGSFATGFCKMGSDADLSFSYSGHNHLLQGITTVDEQNSKKMMRFGKTLAENGMSSVAYVKSRIPVVQFEDPMSSIQCDVTVGNVGGVENSKILRRIHDGVHPVVPLYIFAVKEWAKSKELVAPEKGMFNSFTMTTMAIMVLQELGLVPVFNRCTGLFGELTLGDAERTLAEWKRPAALTQLNAEDDAAMGDAVLFLLSKFAEYYSAFDFAAGTVSIIHPRRVRALYAEVAAFYLTQLREAKLEAYTAYYAANKSAGKLDLNELSQAMHAEEVQRPSNSPFVVEDFVNYINCGRRVQKPRQAACLQTFQDLKGMMAKPDLTIDELLRPYAKLSKTVTDFNAGGDRRVVRFS